MENSSWMMGGYSGIWMLLGTVLTLGFLAFLIWAISRTVLHQTPSVPLPPPNRTDSALEILRQRYARGEIDAETFRQMQATLQDSSPSQNP
jgi:putative membrane protein